MLASLARAYWSVATTPLKAVTIATAIVTPQTQPPKTLTGTKRPADPNTLTNDRPGSAPRTPLRRQPPADDLAISQYLVSD